MVIHIFTKCLFFHFRSNSLKRQKHNILILAILSELELKRKKGHLENVDKVIIVEEKNSFDISYLREIQRRGNE